MTETAAYGTWKSPIVAADVARGAMGSRTRPSPAARCGGRSGGRRRTAGSRSWLPPARQGSRGSCFPPRGTPGPGCTSTAASRTWRCPSLSLAGGFDLVFANFADQRLYAAGGASPEARRIEPVPLTPPRAASASPTWCSSPAARRSGACGRRRCEPTATPCLKGSTSAAAWRCAARSWRCRSTGRPRRRRRRPGARPRRAVLRLPHAVARRHQAGLDQLEPPEHALGRHRVAGHPPSAATRHGRPRNAGHGRPRRVGARPGLGDDASLYAISDSSGFWNLYEVAAAGGTPRPLHPLDEEFAIRSGSSAGAVRAARRRPAGGAARPRRVPPRRARPGLGELTASTCPATAPRRRARRLRHHDHHDRRAARAPRGACCASRSTSRRAPSN